MTAQHATQVLEPRAGDEATNRVVRASRPHRPEEIQRLRRKRRDEFQRVSLASVPRGSVQSVVDHLRDLLSRRFPHPEVHTSVSCQRSVEHAGIVCGDYDWYPPARRPVVTSPLPADAHPCRLIAQVHQRRLRDLVVDGHLVVLEPSHSRVDVVDDEARRGAGGGHVLAGGEVPSSQHRARFARGGILQFPRRYDDGHHTEPLATQLEVEGLADTLPTPHAQHQRSRTENASPIGEKVLGDVTREPVQESVGYVVARVVLDVPELLDVAPGSQVSRGHVRIDTQHRALVKLLFHTRGLAEDIVLSPEGIRALLPSPNRDDSF